MSKDMGTRIMKSPNKGWIWEVTGGPPQQAQESLPESQTRTGSLYTMNSAPQTHFKRWLLKLELCALSL